MSCKDRSIIDLAKITPVTPPIVNKKINPRIQRTTGLNKNGTPYIDANQEKTLTPVGIAITMVAAVKYARVSMSIPIVNMWWAQTTQPSSPMAPIA